MFSHSCGRSQFTIPLRVSLLRFLLGYFAKLVMLPSNGAHINFNNASPRFPKIATLIDHARWVNVHKLRRSATLISRCSSTNLGPLKLQAQR